jgi:hypothetical protein
LLPVELAQRLAMQEDLPELGLLLHGDLL